MQKHLKRSLRTKEPREANIRAKLVLAEFDRIIGKAKALIAARSTPTIKRTNLNDTEIARVAEHVYASELMFDERVRFGGRDEMKRMEAEHLRLKGETIGPWAIPYEQWPRYGMPLQVLQENLEPLKDWLREIRHAAALGDISIVRDQIDLALGTFAIELDEQSPSYSKLGMASLQAYLRALEAIEKRNEGVTVETPRLAQVGPVAAPEGGTLGDALEGWERHRARPKRTVDEFGRSVKMFVQVHGNMPVVAIMKKHALEYRKALQDVPRLRKGELLRATLPAQAAWGREHPGEPKITAATINKQLGGVQSVCIWASQNGLLPDDAQWTDPFSKLRLPEERSERTSFEIAELQLLFDAPVSTEHKFPRGAHGDAGFWLPVLALFTGARQAELGSLTAANVQTDVEIAVPLLYFVTERARGKRVKTDASERVVPVHPEVLRLGFLDYVAARRRADGQDAWLFPSVSPDKGRAGVPAWSQWFGRYLRSTGVIDKAKVFHSFRHTVKDALRRGRADHEIREALIGHAQASTVSWGYGASAMLSRFGAAALSDAVNRISYPGLDLSRVRPFVTEATCGRN